LTAEAVHGYTTAMAGAIGANGDGDGREAPLDWAGWIKGLGKQARRVREFLGLSQEQVARVAGVSQGAVSRFEGGRGLATPLLVVMKVNAALRGAVSAMTPNALSIDARRLLELEEPLPGHEDGHAPPLAPDPSLEELVRIFHDVPERQRARLLAVMRAAANALGGTRLQVSGGGELPDADSADG
jgi:transcriptional regulator with XRE-family HTH domain